MSYDEVTITPRIGCVSPVRSLGPAPVALALVNTAYLVLSGTPPVQLSASAHAVGVVASSPCHTVPITQFSDVVWIVDGANATSGTLPSPSESATTTVSAVKLTPDWTSRVQAFVVSPGGRALPGVPSASRSVTPVTENVEPVATRTRVLSVNTSWCAAPLNSNRPPLIWTESAEASSVTNVKILAVVPTPWIAAPVATTRPGSAPAPASSIVTLTSRSSTPAVTSIEGVCRRSEPVTPEGTKLTSSFGAVPVFETVITPKVVAPASLIVTVWFAAPSSVSGPGPV